MQELDESFQETVKRAVTPFKEDSVPEKPNMDVSCPQRYEKTGPAADTPGPK